MEGFLIFQGGTIMTRFFEKNTFLFFNQHYYTLYLGDFNVGERRTNNFENYTMPSKRFANYI